MPDGMPGRERVQRMFERRDHDRVPRRDTFWLETLQRWNREGLNGDAATVLELLGNDFHSLPRSWPAPYPGRNEIVTEDDQTQVIRNQHGGTERYWKNRDGTPEHINYECDSSDAWYRTIKPAMLATGVQLDLERTAADYRAARERGLWCHLSGVDTFETLRRTIGDLTALMALADEPEWIQDVSRTHTDLVLRDFEAVLAQGIEPDGVWIYGDMAYKNATMCSPTMYRELIWPDHRRLADWAHAHGLPLIFHTDGNVNSVIGLYIEAGFDCLQPLEAKAGMDVRRLCPQYGDRLACFGNIDVMVMGTNDHALIEHEISTKFAAGKATRSYAYHSDHSVPPTVSWETYRFIIDCVHRYGRYD